MKRTLSLKRERLTELTSVDLAAVIAGAELTPVIRTLPVKDCLGLTNTSCECCTASGSC
jgi:hypothetical protein